MKIEHTLDRLAKLKEQQRLKESQNANLEKNREINRDNAQVGSSHGAKVNISEKAKELNMIKEIVKADENSNSDKIAKLKKLIAENKYEIDPEELADKIVDEHIKSEVL